MRRFVTIMLAFWLTGAQSAWADGTQSVPLTPATFWRAWNGDPLIVFNLSLLAVLYTVGFRRFRRRSNTVRMRRPAQAVAYYCSLGVLFVALLSPLGALSNDLAAAHMLQHMLLMVVAAPLFIFGSPARIIIWGLDPGWRSSIAHWSGLLRVRAFDEPLLPAVLQAAALWFWHWPAAYEAALVDPLVHDVQHLSFFAAGCFYWRVFLDPLRLRRLHPLGAMMSLFTTSLQAMLLGIYMALSPVLWYDVYALRTSAWGLTPLEDQQLAGLIMWMPACLVYPAVAGGVLSHWLRTLPQLTRRPQPLRSK